MLIGLLITATALLILLVGEWRQHSATIWIAKPIASMGFLLAAMHANPFQTVFGRTVFLSLTLSWLGDVLLIPAGSWAFLSGLGAFLLAHVGFAIAFAQYGVHHLILLGAAAIMIGMAAAVWRWLQDHVPEPMRVPVLAYIAVITVMVSTAIASAPNAPHPWRQGVGAGLFYLSDLAVARQSFVAKAFVNKLWGLPAYYLAQLCIASLLYF